MAMIEQETQIRPTTTQVKESQTEFSHLPLDILFNVLSRLPVTTLVLVAKYTCKLWYSIINDPVFPDLHLSHALSNPPGYLYGSQDYYRSYFADKTLVITLPEYLQAMCCWFCSCRGLVVYQSVKDDVQYICNPIINDRVELPRLVPLYHGWYGFGYAPIANKYKCVRFSFKNFDSSSKKVEFICHVFTLGDQYWRQVIVPSNMMMWCSNIIYFNGALYCITPGMHFGVKNRLVSFDLDTEKFQQRGTLHLGSEPGHQCLYMYLKVLGETLMLMVLDENYTQEVWILTDEVENVWVKIYCFHFSLSQLNVQLIDYLLWEVWMKQHENDLGPESICNEVARSSSHGPTRNIYNLTISNSANVISPHMVTFHVGSLVSPSKIVEAAIEQRSMVSRSRDVEQFLKP